MVCNHKAGPVMGEMKRFRGGRRGKRSHLPGAAKEVEKEGLLLCSAMEAFAFRRGNG